MGEWVATTSWDPPAEVVQQGGQPERRREGQRRVRLVHQVEALVVHPGAQDLQEPFAVAQLVQPLRPPAGCSSR